MPTEKNPANQKTRFWEITPNTENPDTCHELKSQSHADLELRIDEAQSAQRKLEEASAPGANQAALVSIRDDINEALGCLLLLRPNSDMLDDIRSITQCHTEGLHFAERAQTTAKAAFNAAVQRDKGVEPVTAPAQVGTGAAEKNSLSAPLVQAQQIQQVQIFKEAVQTNVPTNTSVTTDHLKGEVPSSPFQAFFSLIWENRILRYLALIIIGIGTLIGSIWIFFPEKSREYIFCNCFSPLCPKPESQILPK